MSSPPAYLKDNEVLDYFLMSKQVQGCTPKTLLYYKDNLLKYKHYLSAKEIPLLVADQFAIMGFFSKRSTEVSPATLQIYFRALKTFYRWTLEQGFRPDNPMLKIPQPKIPHKVLPIFTPEQINSLLQYCGTTEFLKVRNTAILLVMLDTAIRLAELISMKLMDIDWNNNTIKIQGKGRKERYVQFSTQTALALKKYLLYHPKEYPNVWLSEEKYPLKQSGIVKFFTRLRDRAGIKDVRCSAHTMRHTSACMFLDNEGSIAALQQLLGHSNLKSTEIYIETVRQKQALGEHAKASPVAHLKMK